MKKEDISTRRLINVAPNALNGNITKSAVLLKTRPPLMRTATSMGTKAWTKAAGRKRLSRVSA